MTDPYIGNVAVEYPQGAGGAFLSQVLACCIANQPLQSNIHGVNFHKIPLRTESQHVFTPANNVISIDDPRARYNFWIYYFRKRVALELTYYRHGKHRWIKCPYADLDHREDANWLVNQCRFIINYQSQQHWSINWIQMMENPVDVWPTVCEFLAANKEPNHWNLDRWIDAVNTYRETLRVKTQINVNQVRWQIWATALLINQKIWPDFDMIENFRNPVFVQWLKDHQSYVIGYTQQCHWPLG